jgi:hypothetical protein
LVQESTRGAALGGNEWLPFVTFLLRHGLAGNTVRAILAQLGSEWLSRTNVKWRRVALADRLQFDLFGYYYRRMHPDFATFFVNSTAHLQHAYWRHMDPDAFPLKPAKEEIDSYGDAILFGYRSMDALLGRFFALTDTDTTIILCSALSQQPFLKREGRGGQHFYRLRDVPRFLRLLDIAPRMVEPVMTHQYLFRFVDRAGAEKALATLTQLKLGEATVFGARLSGTDIHFGCHIFDGLVGNGEITGVPGRNEHLYFYDLLYAIDAVKSARHHPDGVLWVHTGEHTVHTEPVSILDIAPTIYDLMGVCSAVGEDAVRGVSLVPRFCSGGQAESACVA